MNYNNVEQRDNMKIEKPVDNIEQERVPRPRMTTAEPVRPKRGLFGRLVKGAFGPDGIRKIAAYVGQDIILPAIKNMLADGLKSGIDMAFFGEVRPSNRSSLRPTEFGRGVPPKVNYASGYKATLEAEPRRISASSYADEFILKDRQEAIGVLNALHEAADQYGYVAIADYYDMIGVTTKFTDNNFGWSIDSISKAVIVASQGGYIVKFPPVEVLR